MRRPSSRAIDAFLEAQRRSSFSYSELGATRRTPPAGYHVDHHRIRLGRGERRFARAAGDIREWRMLQLGWASVCGSKASIEPGTTVAILVRAFGLWSLNGCRIVYVLDEHEDNAVRRFGFAYGTLAEHAESGEERFSVEWNRSDEDVWYDILAFSRPNHWLARLGSPLSRRLQRRFARDSMLAMSRVVASCDGAH